MNIEQIGEPIRMVAAFAGGQAGPVRFEWGGRSYEVAAVNACWTDRSGEGYCLHYSVQVGDETYYAILREYAERYRWQIAVPEDLLRVAEEVSGKELDGLYVHWILSDQK